MSSDVRVRFAPSPTGNLHIGGARTALFNWLYAKHSGGTFVLRIEDTDRARNTAEATQAIYDGLRWLGLDWDEGPETGGNFGPYFQSEREEIYRDYLDRLRAVQRVYDDAGSVRFRFAREKVVFDDLICGHAEFDMTDSKTNPDMTIRRPDGSWIFHFVNVVDDLQMKISHVIRGEDHLSNTPKHVQLYRALGATPPRFAHIPLILNPNGSKMSKRDQGASVDYYLRHGFLPQAVRNYLCLLGWSPKDDREKLAIEEVIRIFDLNQIVRSQAKFDEVKLRSLNGEYMRELDPRIYCLEALVYLRRRGIPVQQFQDVDEAIATSRGKIKVFDELPRYLATYTKGRRYISMIHETGGVEVVDYHEFDYDPAAARKYFTKENENVLFAIRDAVAALDQFDAATLESTLKTTAESLHRKIGTLVHPLRLACTGETVGPSLYHLMAILGKERVIQLINRAIAEIGNRQTMLTMPPPSSDRAHGKRR